MQGLRRRLAERPPRRVLVVQTAWLGDTVFTSALAAALLARFPGAQLELCVSPRGRDVALAIEGVQAALVYDKNGADRGAGGLWRMARRLRERGYDLAVVPHRSLRSGLLARLARVPERLGFAGTAAGLFCTARAPDAGATFLEREASLLMTLGAAPAPMRLRPTPEQLAQADAALVRLGLSGRAVAALCPGSEWPTKMWPAPRFAELAAGLAERGFAPLLLGSPREVALAEEVRRLAQVPVQSAAGNSVGESLGMLFRARLAVGGDSGLLHAARALGTRTVVMFGPTTPDAHVFAAGSRALSLRLDCSPCSSHGSRRCPLGHHRCLRDLGTPAVLAACDALGSAA
jgi:heptosyltransferase-2